MTDKVKCGDCERELISVDEKCPSCGSVKKAYEINSSVTIGLRAGAEIMHEAKMGSLGWTISGLVVGLPFSIIMVVIGSLNLKVWQNGLIALGILLFSMAAIWMARYQYIAFLRWLDNAFTGKKTFRSK